MFDWMWKWEDETERALSFWYGEEIYVICYDVVKEWRENTGDV